jgi:hypothetical protein
MISEATGTNQRRCGTGQLVEELTTAVTPLNSSLVLCRIQLFMRLQSVTHKFITAVEGLIPLNSCEADDFWRCPSSSHITLVTDS